MSAHFLPNTEGVYLDLPEAVYRSAPGISNSSSKHVRQSPLHYWHHLNAPKDKPSAAQVFGTVLHGRCLEPGRSLHVVRPEGMDYRSKDGKAWRDAQTLAIITAEESVEVEGAATALWANPVAAKVLKRSQKEVSVFKRHEATGLLLKGRLDLVFSDDAGMTTVADLKTCEDASPAAFARDCRKWLYHRQAAYYLDLLGASAFLFVAVEKQAPYGVAVYQMDDESIERGRALYEADLALIAQCQETGVWPGYAANILPLSVRDWKEVA